MKWGTGGKYLSLFLRLRRFVEFTHNACGSEYRAKAPCKFQWIKAGKGEGGKDYMSNTGDGDKNSPQVVGFAINAGKAVFKEFHGKQLAQA